MRTIKEQRIEFANPDGDMLAAALVSPAGSVPRAYALFAHCFTCGKNSSAAARIGRALAEHGVAVLRFDFTGLGNSQGEFGNAGFAGNVRDLVAAADFMREKYAAPALLIGHSLGGTAVLAAAEQIAECRGLVTIGSPATPAHVLQSIRVHQPTQSHDAENHIPVSIGGREFSISPAFIEDLKRDPVSARIQRLRRALLVFHAPFDGVVSVDEAGQIFQQAKHPKSFVSLDGANHLLTNPDDARYVADTIAVWAQRYLPAQSSKADERERVLGGHVIVGEVNRKFTRRVSSDNHRWIADEPSTMGGDDLGPDPYEHLLAALGTCTSMTLRMYANRKNWPMDDVHIELSHRRAHIEDCADCDGAEAKVDLIERRVTIEGDLTPAQHERLQQIADRCPVHKTLVGDVRIVHK